jgi:hypothetical protein
MVYVTGPPPVSVGGSQVSDPERNPAVATTFLGGRGFVLGTTGAEGAEVDVRPTEFLTVTVKVYGIPLVSSVIRADNAPG